MVVKKRAGLLLSGTVLASIFAAAPALAQDAQNEEMQRTPISWPARPGAC
jgi:hypothetical protein